jgi:hypothetical protein
MESAVFLPFYATAAVLTDHDLDRLESLAAGINGLD